MGDVLNIINGNGDIIAKYAYDAWGNVVSIVDCDFKDKDGNIVEKNITNDTTSTDIAVINPIRYRGYYLDRETGFYYLQSRYYDPAIGRFLNIDDPVVLKESPMVLTDKNLYAYCDNNTVTRIDDDGEFWETAFDVISLSLSIVDVAKNPSDPLAWVGLVGDAVDLIPFVTGVGEIVRTIKVAKKTAEAVDDLHDTAKVIDNVNDGLQTTIKKIHGNSLNSPKTNYGYVLVDADNNIMKFGETVNPKTRYTKKYLNENGYTMKILESGSKADIHYWQYDMNMYYKSKYGVFPPLNKRGW